MMGGQSRSAKDTTIVNPKCPSNSPETPLDRRRFLKLGVAGSAAMAAPPSTRAAEASASPGQGVRSFELEETTIAALQQAMKSGRLTAHSITEKYLAPKEGIYVLGSSLHSIIEDNPDTLAIRRSLNSECKAKRR